MNIRVDLNTSIKDGTEVVFRSPVDCSQVTGLIVYYTGGSQEFVFADAHGNNVGDIDHLFAENVAVKVILDTTTGMAFVQNADTNAYLEGRFDGIIDKLCPAFTESGSAVILDCPLEGYPLHIEAYDSPVIHLGKNLVGHYDFNNAKGVDRVISCKDGVYTVEFTADRSTAMVLTTEADAFWKNRRFPPGKYTFSIKQEGTDTYDVCYAVAQYDDGSNEAVNGYPKHDWWTLSGIYCSRKTMKKGTKISFTLQIEAGTKATDHVPCQMEVYNPKVYEEDGPEWVCEDVMPMSERDMFFTAYSEDGHDVPLTVTGKKDPVALLNKLEATVNALLGG